MFVPLHIFAVHAARAASVQYMNYTTVKGGLQLKFWSKSHLCRTAKLPVHFSSISIWAYTENTGSVLFRSAAKKGSFPKGPKKRVRRGKGGIRHHAGEPGDRQSRDLQSRAQSQKERGNFFMGYAPFVWGLVEPLYMLSSTIPVEVFLF